MHRTGRSPSCHYGKVGHDIKLNQFQKQINEQNYFIPIPLQALYSFLASRSASKPWGLFSLAWRGNNSKGDNAVILKLVLLEEKTKPSSQERTDATLQVDVGGNQLGWALAPERWLVLFGARGPWVIRGEESPLLSRTIAQASSKVNDFHINPSLCVLFSQTKHDTVGHCPWSFCPPWQM